MTGGAGFIGSHLVDALRDRGCDVIVFDDLSSGDMKNLHSLRRVKFVRVDLKSRGLARLVKDAGPFDTVFHFAANPEVKVGETRPEVHFEENLVATFSLLEALRKTSEHPLVIFTSTSTVYGDASVLPTPEDYGPLVPISTYGASKLGCESLIASYCHTFGFRAATLRLANVVGVRSKLGVTRDFIEKLRKDSSKLEILGDGSQTKSYVHVKDCIEAVLKATDSLPGDEGSYEVYNVGSFDSLAVSEVARIVVEAMGLKNVELKYTGGVAGGRGWLGDVKRMHLSIDKLVKLGWTPEYDSYKAVKLAAEETIDLLGCRPS